MSESVTMWAISLWSSVPAPARLDVVSQTVPEGSYYGHQYYGHHHGYGHTVYVHEDSVFECPLAAAAAWYAAKRKYWARIRAETDAVLAELMPGVFGPGWEDEPDGI